MVIYDFDVVGLSVVPRKADAPLAVDANTPLFLPLSSQLLEPAL
jgi:hypothetical protein